jgi:hypothetical protein
VGQGRFDHVLSNQLDRVLVGGTGVSRPNLKSAAGAEGACFGGDTRPDKNVNKYNNTEEILGPRWKLMRRYGTVRG